MEDSHVVLAKSRKLFQSLLKSDSNHPPLLTDLLERLILLKKRCKSGFDLESFTRTSRRELEALTLDCAYKKGKGAEQDATVNLKREVKSSFNHFLLLLFKSLQREEEFERSVVILFELTEFEQALAEENRGAKNSEFLEFVLILLFTGDFYNSGLVNHFLLVSEHTLALPLSLNNILRGSARTKKIANLLKEDEDADMSLFYERFIIFVTKLETPDLYLGGNHEGVKGLKIPKKELALKNSIGYFEDVEAPEDDNSVSGYEDAESSDGSDANALTVQEEDEAKTNFYKSNYTKLWENIFDTLLRTVECTTLVIILESLPRRVFPYLYNPLKIADFLYNNLHESHSDLSPSPALREEVVTNCLNCLFHLILYYNLTDQNFSKLNHHTGGENYGQADNFLGKKSQENNESTEFDWFYMELYRLIDVKYLSVNSNVTLILLLERALGSSMLPNKLVASFVKRLVTLATVIESKFSNCLLVIALHLVQKHHHHLLHLVHHESDHPLTTTQNHLGDHNDLNGMNGDNGEANEMFLFELYLLLNHFNSDTLKIVGLFFTELKNKIFNLKDFITTENTGKCIERSRESGLNPFKGTVQNSTTLSKSLFNLEMF